MTDVLNRRGPINLQGVDQTRAQHFALIVTNAIAICQLGKPICSSCGVYHANKERWPVYPAEVTDPSTGQILKLEYMLCGRCDVEMQADAVALRRLFVQ